MSHKTPKPPKPPTFKLDIPDSHIYPDPIDLLLFGLIFIMSIALLIALWIPK